MDHRTESIEDCFVSVRGDGETVALVLDASGGGHKLTMDRAQAGDLAASLIRAVTRPLVRRLQR